MLTLPFLGVQFPVMTWQGEEPPEWWLWRSHRASELEQTLSSWRKTMRLLDAGSAFLEAPYPFP